jgi:PAS domain S-box-containing protein
MKDPADEARFRAIFENAAVGIARVSLDGRFLEVNDRLCQIVGYSCDELMSRNFRTITHPDDVETDLEAQRQMLAGETSSYMREKRYYCKDGSVVRCNLSVALLRKADGSPDYFISVVEDNSARKEAEQKLREKEERLRLATEAAGLGVFEWEVRTDTAVWENQRMYDIFGHTPVDGTLSKAKLLEDYVHPEDVASLDLALAEGMKSSRSFQTLYRIRRKDGAARWLSLCAKFEHRHTGIRMIGVLADITEHHQAQEGLRVREERFRTLADTAPVLIWIAGPDKLCTFFNKPWLDFTGRNLEEQLGNGWTQGIHPEDRDGCLGTYGAKFDARESFELEYRLRRYDGQYRWILDRGIPRFSPRDTFLGYIGTCIDITDQKATETALRESEERLAGIVSSAMDAIITVDDSQTIVLFNEAAEHMFGCTAAETLGQSIDRFIPGRFLPEHAEHLRRFGKTPGRGRGTGRLGMLTARRANGTEFPVEVSISTIQVRGRTLYTVIYRDITERKLAEAEREELAREQVARATAEADSRSKDEFVALVSHELRSPLTTILGYTRMLRSGLAGPGHLDKAMAVIERSAQAQLQIIEDLLDSARIITGKLQIEPTPTDLIPILEAALETVRRAAEDKNITLIDKFSQYPQQVIGDATRLQQIVWNLLSNAVKFTGENGRIELAMAREGDSVRIQVSDNGKGIALEFLPLLFDRFSQADSSSSRRHGGLGLGLALVKHLVELHGGTITAASEGAGCGATFTITLPRRPGPVQP